MRIHRRDFVLLTGVGLFGFACKPDKTNVDATPSRCNHCGMRIDAASAWRAELVAADGAVTTFDTPRCALMSWRMGKSQATSLRVQEYYDRSWRSAEELRFVVGGDVVGPMGPDFVPVDPGRVTKFIQDHGADHAYRLEELTVEVLSASAKP